MWASSSLVVFYHRCSFAAPPLLDHCYCIRNFLCLCCIYQGKVGGTLVRHGPRVSKGRTHFFHSVIEYQPAKPVACSVCKSGEYTQLAASAWTALLASSEQSGCLAEQSPPGHGRSCKRSWPGSWSSTHATLPLSQLCSDIDTVPCHSAADSSRKAWSSLLGSRQVLFGE
jgi:hypothetical protein